MNKKTTDKLTEIKKQLSDCGLKITPQRIAVYLAVLKSGKHPSADKVFRNTLKDNPNISFDTVNRTLLSFAEYGILNIVEGYTSARRYDCNINKHHHYRCIKCDALFDCFNLTYANIDTPDDVPKNFKILRKRVIIEGICNNCRKK